MVKFIPLADLPTRHAKGFSIYREMPEWIDAQKHIARRATNNAIKIELSHQSIKGLKCKKPAQQFAKFVREELRAQKLNLSAYALKGKIYIAPPENVPNLGRPPARAAGPPQGMPNVTRGYISEPGKPTVRFSPGEGTLRKKAPKTPQPHPHAKVQFKAKACARCGQEFIPRGPRSKFCEREDCAKEPTPPPPSIPAPVEVASFEYGGYPQGGSFTASELMGMKPVEAMIHWARRHDKVLNPREASPFFALAQTFGVSNEAAVESKLRQLLLSGAAQRFFEAHSGGLFELRGRGVAA